MVVSGFYFIFADDNQKSCISLIISIVVSTVLFMVTIYKVFDRMILRKWEILRF